MNSAVQNSQGTRKTSDYFLNFSIYFLSKQNFLSKRGNNMSKERNYGIDCLRILATYFICIHHILGHGGALLTATPFSPTFIMLSVISSIVTCAVNCYGLISGYVGINRQFSYKSLINMWKNGSLLHGRRSYFSVSLCA